MLSDRRTLVDLEAAAQGLDGLSAAGRRRASETLLQPSFMPPIALQLPLPDASGKDGRLRLQMCPRTVSELSVTSAVSRLRCSLQTM